MNERTEPRRAPPLWAVFGVIAFDFAIDCTWGWCWTRRRP